MISLCMTCHNRLWQLKQTLYHNLEVCKEYGFEICLVDYGSKDGLSTWIKENFTSSIKDKSLIFFQTESHYFDAPHAKNIAHSLATHPFIGNLDCDNYISKQTLKILEILENNKNAFIQNWSGSYIDGTYGRLFLSKSNFLRLGGYSQHLEGMTYQDTDFINRSKTLGLDYLLLPFSHTKLPVYNTVDDKKKHIKNPFFFSKVKKKNRWIYRSHRWLGVIQANKGQFFGQSQGQLNFSTIVFKSGLLSHSKERNNFVIGLKYQLEDVIFILKHKVFIPLYYFIYSKLHALYSNIISPLYYSIVHKAYSIFLHKVIYRCIRILKRIKNIL